MDNTSPPQSRIITAALPVSSRMAEKSKGVLEVSAGSKLQEHFQEQEAEDVSLSHVLPLPLSVFPAIGVSHSANASEKKNQCKLNKSLSRL